MEDPPGAFRLFLLPRRPHRNQVLESEPFRHHITPRLVKRIAVAL